MRRSGRLSVLAATSALLASPISAHATYSVVAADTATGHVGGSGTSCLNGQDVYIIYGSVPGVAVVHTQAAYRTDVHAHSVELVQQGLEPSAVIQALRDPALDAEADTRQFGVVNVTGRSAGFTGSLARAYAADRQGVEGRFSYSVQGNILTSEAVLSQAADAFEASGCDLAERLLRALEAGAEHSEGDSRCTASRGIPADSAFLQVDRPGEAAGSYLRLRVPSSGDESPLPALRAAFDSWRLTHPCPLAGTDAGAPPSDPPLRGESRDAGCGCRLAAGPARRSLGPWVLLGALLLIGLGRWNPQRFQC